MNTKYILDNEDNFNLIREKILIKASKYLKHGSIAQEITDSVLLAFLEISDLGTNLEPWISRQVERETESYVENLWHFTFGYAISLVKDPDKAQDLTQSVMLAFLSSKKNILCVKGWLRRTAFNLAMKDIKGSSRDHGISAEIEAGIRFEPQSTEEDCDDLREELTRADIKRILSAAEFAEWNNLSNSPSLKDYAEKNGINYPQARKRKHILSKKIKSTFLQEQGWVGTPEILDYQTLNNIKRFMSTLLQYSAPKGIKDINRYCPAKLRPLLIETLAGFQKIDDWGILKEAPSQYRICMVDASEPSEPKIALINFRINRSNQIRIGDCQAPELLGTAPESMAEPVPIDRGRCLLSIEDVLRLVT